MVLRRPELPPDIDPIVEKCLRTALGKSSMFPPTPHDLAALAVRGERRRFEPGEVVYHQGEDSRFCHLVLQGQVELLRPGERDRVVARLRPGEFAGDIALLLGIPYLSTARAEAPCTTFRLARAQVVDTLRHHPALTFGWLTAVVSQLAASHGHVEVMLGRTAREQVAGALLEHANSRGVVPISQSGLASLLGLGRQTVNRALAELAELGLVRTAYRSVEVVDPEGLTEVYGGTVVETH